MNRGGAFLLVGLSGVALTLAGCGPNLPPTMGGSGESNHSIDTSSGGEAPSDWEGDSAASPEGAPVELEQNQAMVASAPAEPSAQMDMLMPLPAPTAAPARTVRRSASGTTAAGAKFQRERATPAPDQRDPTADDSSSQDHRLSLIYDATIELSVFEAEKTIDAAEKLARDAGGYVVQRNDHAVQFRVPAEKFQATFDAALALGDVLHRRVSVRDVTEEFRDLRIRLRNAEAMRDRLEQLLAHADKVGDALQVEHELERIADEIELLKGKLTMLQELTAFSTITVNCAPRPVDRVDSQVRLPFPWLDELGLSELLSL